MRYNKKIVWGICYSVRINSNAKWCPWVGPVGVFGMAHIPKEIRGELSGRPYFFSTRKDARKVAKAKTWESNKTWTWCKCRVKKYHLMWEEV